MAVLLATNTGNRRQLRKAEHITSAADTAVVRSELAATVGSDMLQPSGDGIAAACDKTANQRSTLYRRWFGEQRASNRRQNSGSKGNNSYNNSSSDSSSGTDSGIDNDCR